MEEDKLGKYPHFLIKLTFFRYSVYPDTITITTLYIQARHLSFPQDALPRLIHSMAQRISVAFIRTQAQVLHIRVGADICFPVLSHIPLISTAADL